MRPAIKFEAHTGKAHVSTGRTLAGDALRLIGGTAWAATRYCVREAYQYAHKCHWWV